MTLKNIFTWALKLVVAIILLQTLYFKFTAHAASVHIFTELGIEPWGRITLGIVELIVSILVLWPKTAHIGMLLSFLVILGAIGSHFLVLGINVMSDCGSLFLLAIIVAIASLIYIVMHKLEITLIINTIWKHYAIKPSKN
jgi:putative oxidoreductase